MTSKKSEYILQYNKAQNGFPNDIQLVNPPLLEWFYLMRCTTIWNAAKKLHLNRIQNCSVRNCTYYNKNPFYVENE